MIRIVSTTPPARALRKTALALITTTTLVFAAPSTGPAQTEPGQQPPAGEADAVWEAPEEARAVENPIAVSPEAEEEGSGLYRRYCRRCHGDIGKGDGMATAFIQPPPKDITTAEAQDRMSDGEIFYKITEGKKPMPAMGERLSEDERWKIVLFVRTLRAE